jgi:hypothetical protein
MKKFSTEAPVHVECLHESAVACTPLHAADSVS